MRLGPAHIHTHEHLRPVLRLGAAGAAVYLHHAVHRILLLSQHVHQLQLLDGLQSLPVVAVYLILGDHLVLEEVEGQLQLVGLQPDVIVAVNPSFDAFHLLHLLLSPFGIFPEVGSLCAEILFLPLHLLLVNAQVMFQFVGAIEYILQLFLGNHASVNEK